MRFFLLLFFALTLQAQAQAQPKKPNQAYFGYFKWEEEPVADSSGTITIGNYKGQVIDRGFVTENPAVAKEVLSLLQKLQANGTEDINKCFIPRHYIGLYRYDSLVKEVLVCFECDGIRFSNEVRTTRVKSVAKREQWMRRLKELFEKFHYDVKK